MTTYYSIPEIESAMKLLVADYLKNCLECDKISDDFKDLIKYNFLAKYVTFNRIKQSIEIGIEDLNTNNSHYPVIKIVSFEIKETDNNWLENSFKNKMNDLVFYGKLINRKKFNHRNSEVIVI